LNKKLLITTDKHLRDVVIIETLWLSKILIVR